MNAAARSLLSRVPQPACSNSPDIFRMADSRERMSAAWATLWYWSACMPASRTVMNLMNLYWSRPSGTVRSCTVWKMCTATVTNTWLFEKPAKFSMCRQGSTPTKAMRSSASGCTETMKLFMSYSLLMEDDSERSTSTLMPVRQLVMLFCSWAMPALPEEKEPELEGGPQERTSSGSTSLASSVLRTVCSKYLARSSVYILLSIISSCRLRSGMLRLGVLRRMPRISATSSLRSFGSLTSSLSSSFCRMLVTLVMGASRSSWEWSVSACSFFSRWRSFMAWQRRKAMMSKIRRTGTMTPAATLHTTSDSS
mmetsp:Transcript_2774/g.7839  ORF Transcript_2774/g.7839 Transcript_2774/m.7839 type:complete len:310 (+) Transcript_2774:1837-2766(+)